MTQVNNFNLTGEELKLAKDQSFILTKLEVIRKVSELFGQLERELKSNIAEFELEKTGANVSAGKIFRGENYQQFPYVLLDYPRIFNTQTVFAFRSMFWWGNEFSFTLHLQGEAWQLYKENVLRNLKESADEEIYCCINDTPWKYHFNPDNYELLSALKSGSKIDQLAEKPFLKVSKRLSIDQFSDVLSFGKKTMNEFFLLLK